MDTALRRLGLFALLVLGVSGASRGLRVGWLGVLLLAWFVWRIDRRIVNLEEDSADADARIEALEAALQAFEPRLSVLDESERRRTESEQSRAGMLNDFDRRILRVEASVEMLGRFGPRQAPP